MRGADGHTKATFTMARLTNFVPGNHSLRPIRICLHESVKRMDLLFARMHESATKGNPLVPIKLSS